MGETLQLIVQGRMVIPWHVWGLKLKYIGVYPRQLRIPKLHLEDLLSIEERRKNAIESPN